MPLHILYENFYFHFQQHIAKRFDRSNVITIRRFNSDGVDTAILYVFFLFNLRSTQPSRDVLSNAAIGFLVVAEIFVVANNFVAVADLLNLALV